MHRVRKCCRIGEDELVAGLPVSEMKGKPYLVMAEGSLKLSASA